MTTSHAARIQLDDVSIGDTIRIGQSSRTYTVLAFDCRHVMLGYALDDGQTAIVSEHMATANQVGIWRVTE